MPKFKPSLKRSVGRRLPGRTYYLFSEGSVTEKDYFEALERACEGSYVKIVFRGGLGVPSSVLAAAKDFISSTEIKKSRKSQGSMARFDEVWVVFDRDEFPCYDQAIAEARDVGINVARSNPCFENWMILHYEDYDRSEHRSDTQKHFERLCPDYDRKKRKTTNCNEVVKAVGLAEDRAEKQLKRRRDEGREEDAPSTTVHLLTSKIRKRKIR